MWNPAFFGIKPDIIIKGGMIIGAKMGDPNASIPTPQPVFYRHMFGAHGGAKYNTCITFVSKESVKNNIKEKLHLKKNVLPVENCRNIGKKDMKLNDKTPLITVDPETYEVKADNVSLTCEAAMELPLTQLYNLF